MNASRKGALTLFLLHSIMPIWVLLRLLRIQDGTERWANTLIYYIVDFPLVPVFLWFQDNPRIDESYFINTGISLILGGLLYGGIGWFGGYWIIDRKKHNGPN